MSGRRSLLPVAAVAAVVTAALLFLFRDPLARSMALPLAWIVWVLRSASVLVGQRIAWVVFVLVFAAAALLSLRALREAKPVARQQQRFEGGRSRIQHWESVLWLDRGSAAARHVLVLELRRLAVSVLAHTDGGDAETLERRVVSRAIDVPACVRDLFGEAYFAERPRRGRRARVPPVRLPVEEIVGALTARLGGKGDT